jgi:8-oxo-dGTP diphosphatase
MSVQAFTIRVYGLFIQDGAVLLSDEYSSNLQYTKFPGGGLEFGEGIIECLKRECMEELGQDVEVLFHFYTGDFFIPSAFDASKQVLSIYYMAKIIGKPTFQVKTKPFDFDNKVEGSQIFRWVKISDLHESDFMFPFDKRVVHLLKSPFIPY